MNDAFFDALDELPSERRPGVLVADGNEMVRRIMEEDLELEGIAVWAARDGIDALKQYQRHRDEIDLVLLEVCMADGDGLRTLAALRKINPEVRCCFMTGQSGGLGESELKAKGAVGLLRKPFNPKAVARILRGPLNRPYREAAWVKDGVAAGAE